MKKLSITFAGVVVALSFSCGAWALPFVTNGGTDTTSSLGRFTIQFVGGPKVMSPLLYDPNTTIGRSDPFLHGSFVDTNGTGVCQNEACTTTKLVSDADFTVIPLANGKPFEQGPLNADEIHTQILSLDMKDINGASANEVRLQVGRDSIGEVESLDAPPANPIPGYGGFPAESFFNVFVEIKLDQNLDNIVDMTLFNKTALLIENGNLMGFPPNVLYVHGNSSAVKLYDLANPNELIGWLVLAGHGIDYKNTPEDKALFVSQYAQLTEMPIPEPSSLSLFAAGLGLFGFRKRARRLEE